MYSKTYKFEILVYEGAISLRQLSRRYYLIVCLLESSWFVVKSVGLNTERSSLGNVTLPLIGSIFGLQHWRLTKYSWGVTWPRTSFLRFDGAWLDNPLSDVSPGDQMSHLDCTLVIVFGKNYISPICLKFYLGTGHSSVAAHFTCSCALFLITEHKCSTYKGAAKWYSR